MTATPTLETQLVAVPGTERLPLRVALLMAENDVERPHVQDLQVDVMSFHIELPLGRAIQDSLAASLSQVFDRVNVVRTAPRSGDYDVVLVPKVGNATWSSSSNFFVADISFALTSTVGVLDRANDTIATFQASGEGKLSMGATAEIANKTGPLASQAVAQVVRKLMTQLTQSPALRQYAARARPSPTASGGSVPRPADVVISFSYPAEAARVADETITVVGLVTAPRGIQRLDLVVNGRPLPVARDVRVQATDLQNHPFTARVPLTPGENVIAVTAVDTAGGAVQAARTVIRETPAAAVAA
ncbi:MAG: hypothetical protein HY216_05780, partial [Candidatus Rokubacteria bacterium]|nr:hypothetical protein [Candidatus Rokubacteria bacterium]